MGLSRGQVLRSIQLPQALTAMLPALVGQLVVILKDSALGTAITYPELLQQGRDAGTAYAAVIPAYVVVALIFIVINYGLTVLAGRVERRINRRGRAAGGTITNAMPGAPGGTGAMASTGLAGRQRAEPRPPGLTGHEEGPGPGGPGPSSWGAPPVGLEPTTCRLTVGCSAN